MTESSPADLAAARRARSARMNALIRGERPAAPAATAAEQDQDLPPAETGYALMNRLIRGQRPDPPEAA